MNPAIRRRLGIAAVAALLSLAGLLAAADRILGLLPRLIARQERAVGARLRGAGMLALWSFDEVHPREQVGGGGVVSGGTRLVPGRHGAARSFLPGEHGIVRTSLPLDALKDRFTFSCWLRFPERPPNQRIFEHLAVSDGRLVLALPNQEELVWPVAIVGRFFHLAFTADPSAGRVTLYIEGEQAGQRPLNPLRFRPEPLRFGQDRWTPPPDFALDEVSIWDRPLAPADVRRLSRMRLPLAVDTAFLAALQLRLAQMARSSYRALLLAADLFNPFLHESRIYSSGLPTYALSLSRADLKEFNAYANRQAENGLNLPGTSKKRTVEVLAGERRHRAVLELLAGSYGGSDGSAKWAFRLEVLSDDDEPERTLLVRPIEGASYLVDVLSGKVARDCGIPAVPPALCIVSVNGMFEGLFLCSEVSRDQGLFWLSAPGQAQALLRRAPVFRDEVLADFDRLRDEWEGVLRSDRKSPRTSREILHDLRRQRRLLEETVSDVTTRSDAALVERVAVHVREDLFLGGNPHADLVVGDLDLSTRRINGAELSFVSLAPEILASDGRIAPPEGKPAPAGLRVTVRSGEAVRTKDLSFVVLPAPRRIPILRVQSGGDPPIGDTVPSLAEFIEGDNHRSGLLPGAIRLRGNTSLHQARNQKKYYRIELERPYDIPGVGRTRLLLLISGWKDKTLMRDRLAYDLFRSFSERGRPRYSPHVRLIELVLNGDYRGIYNLVDRVDADLLDLGTASSGAARAVLYKGVDSSASFRTPNRDAYVQRIPSWRDGEHWGPFDSLITFIGQSPPEVFRRDVERIIDVDNVIDFEILLAFTANAEGTNSNLYLARAGGPGARFFIVPWDYDISFSINSIPSNYLIQRLHEDLPDYGRRVAERWRALRRDRLSEASLMERIDGLVAEMAEGIERNYRRWPPTEGETWEGEVPRLRTFVRERLRLLDGRFARPPGEAGGGTAEGRAR